MRCHFDVRFLSLSWFFSVHRELCQPSCHPDMERQDFMTLSSPDLTCLQAKTIMWCHHIPPEQLECTCVNIKVFNQWIKLIKLVCCGPTLSHKACPDYAKKWHNIPTLWGSGSQATGQVPAGGVTRSNKIKWKKFRIYLDLAKINQTQSLIIVLLCWTLSKIHHKSFFIVHDY